MELLTAIPLVIHPPPKIKQPLVCIGGSPLPPYAADLFSNERPHPCFCTSVIHWNGPPSDPSALSLFEVGASRASNLSSCWWQCEPGARGSSLPSCHSHCGPVLLQRKWSSNLQADIESLPPIFSIFLPPATALSLNSRPSLSDHTYGEFRWAKTRKQRSFRVNISVPTFTLHQHTSSSIKWWRKKPLNFPC